MKIKESKKESIVMKGKILILSLYPAPYRMLLFSKLREKFDIDIFFETSQGDERNSKWFYNNGAYLLDSKEGKKEYKNACQQLRKYNLVVFYEYSTKESFKLICLCKFLKIPYAINCDGVMITSKDNIIKNWVKTFLIKTAAAHLASGEHAKEYFMKYGAKEETIHIHTFSSINAEDMLKTVPTKQEKYQLRKRLNLPVESKIAIAVGRFIPLKRYDELIRSWKKMPENYYLLLIGGGPKQENYEQTVQELQMNNVIIEPFHPMQELFEYYKASDVFVHPTSYDVWGLVVNEAMACGLPVVVSDKCVGGLELVEQGVNGYIVPVGNCNMMIEKARYVLENDDVAQNMAERCLATIRPYTINNMAETHVKVFEELIK